MTRRPVDGWTADLRALYERRAELQYATPRALPDPALDRKFERTLELVRAELPCRSFLDAGCGDGRFLAALANVCEPPPRLSGVDISARILDTARATVAGYGLDVEFVRAGLEQLPFPDGMFDLVLCSQAIEHLPEPAAGLRELRRVLAPAGRAIVTTLNERMLVSRALNAPRTALVKLLRLERRRVPVEFPEWSFRPGELASLMERSGLQVEWLETFRFHLRYPLDRPVLQRSLNRIDKLLPAHGLGDVLAAVATPRQGHPATEVDENSRRMRWESSTHR